MNQTKTHRLVRGNETALFRPLEGGLVRVRHTKERRTLAVRLLTIAQGRQLWRELLGQGFRLLK
jgi:hypothetical protein